MSNRSVVEDRRPHIVPEKRTPAEAGEFWRGAARAATIGIFLILLGITLYLTRTIMLPIVSAVIIGTMLGPLSARLARAGIPSPVVALLLLILLMAVFYAVIALVSTPLIDWVGRAPEHVARIKDKLQALSGPLAILERLRDAILPAGSGTGFHIELGDLVQPALAVLTPAVSALLIFFGTFFFFLQGRSNIRRLFVALIDDHEGRLSALRILSDVEHHLASYLSVVAVIYAGVGIAACTIAYFVGLPNPLAWGMLAFVLNFIPYLGPFMMLVSLLVAGLVTFPTLGHALVAPLIFLGVSTLEGQFITPSIVGRHLTMNTLTVFLSLVFWTWLWGPAGAFLATPILIVGLVVASHLLPSDVPDLPE